MWGIFYSPPIGMRLWMRAILAAEHVGHAGSAVSLGEKRDLGIAAAGMGLALTTVRIWGTNGNVFVQSTLPHHTGTSDWAIRPLAT